MLKVKLLEHTPNPELVIASAAKLCYSPVGIDEICATLEDDISKAEKFLDMLVKIGHHSPLEHVTFTFGVEGVSRITEQQLTRHRVASYSIQSGRYVTRSNAEFVVPPSIEEDEEIREIYDDMMRKDQEAYDTLLEKLQQKKYDKAVTSYINGEDIKSIDDIPVRLLDKLWNQCQKEAAEDARYVFPQSLATKIIFTMNARELIHFFAHRTCLRAQWEIRELAMEMIRHLKVVCPTLFKIAGPSCLNGNCKEGAMSCGKPFVVKERFAKLG